MRFNLSEWALNHRSFVIYLMIAAVILGVLTYLRLGRDEDPAFSIKTMVVSARWCIRVACNWLRTYFARETKRKGFDTIGSMME